MALLVKKCFNETGTSVQLKEIQNIFESISLDQHFRATQSPLWKDGQRDAAQVLKSQKNIGLHQTLKKSEKKVNFRPGTFFNFSSQMVFENH